MWRLDLVGPLQRAPGGFTHLLVAVDKFSKWIEARPIAKIKSKQAVQFFTDIVYRFGVAQPPDGTGRIYSPTSPWHGAGVRRCRMVSAGVGHHATQRT